MKKKQIGAICIVSVMSILLTGCCLSHDWQEATCTTPKTCIKCGETEGEALGHEWQEVTCTKAKTCSVCGESEGEALGHDWQEAICTEPKTCSICGETEGEALGHTWVEAACATPKTCSICAKTEGKPLGHAYNKANYQTPATCGICGSTVGKPETAEFDEYDSMTIYTAEDGIYDFVTSSDSNTSKKVTGKLYVSHYRVFEGDSTYVAREGYEWRTVRIVLSVPSDVSFGVRLTDYYLIGCIAGLGKKDSTHGWTVYPVNYYGVDYPECAAIVYRSWIWGLSEYEIKAYFRVPIGYDGAVLSFYDGELDGSLIRIVPHKNTVHIRLK